jgi:hypothetical protein
MKAAPVNDAAMAALTAARVASRSQQAWLEQLESAWRRGTGSEPGPNNRLPSRRQSVPLPEELSPAPCPASLRATKRAEEDVAPGRAEPTGQPSSGRVVSQRPVQALEVMAARLESRDEPGAQRSISHIPNPVSVAEVSARGVVSAEPPALQSDEPFGPGWASDSGIPLRLPLQRIHITVQEDGVAVWIRDAALVPTTAEMTARQVVAMLRSAGTRVHEVYVNGHSRFQAQRPTSDTAALSQSPLVSWSQP